MNTAQSFIEFFETSFQDENDRQMTSVRSREFYAEVIHSLPIKLKLLESYLLGGNFKMFYQTLADIKYLIEFSDDLNRYWHLLRGYSEALVKLKADISVKASKKIYFDYFDRYGDRRFLRDDNWFEKKRWEFLDELLNIYSIDELRSFMLKYRQAIIENLNIYKSFIVLFVKDLQKIKSASIEKK